MCHPIAMVGLQVATSLVGAMGQASDYKYQAQIERMRGQHAMQIAVSKAEFSRYAAERASAAHRVKIFTSGVDPKSASAVDVLAEDRGNRSIDELNDFYQGQIALYDSEIKAKSLRRAAKAAIGKSLIGVAGTLLTRAIDPYGSLSAAGG